MYIYVCMYVYVCLHICDSNTHTHPPTHTHTHWCGQEAVGELCHVDGRHYRQARLRRERETREVSATVPYIYKSRYESRAPSVPRPTHTHEYNCRDVFW
jgi:hypothetical protein